MADLVYLMGNASARFAFVKCTSGKTIMKIATALSAPSSLPMLMCPGWRPFLAPITVFTRPSPLQVLGSWVRVNLAMCILRKNLR